MRLGASHPAGGDVPARGVRVQLVFLLLHLGLGVAPRLGAVSAADGVTNGSETDPRHA